MHKIVKNCNSLNYSKINDVIHTYIKKRFVNMYLKNTVQYI